MLKVRGFSFIRRLPELVSRDIRTRENGHGPLVPASLNLLRILSYSDFANTRVSVGCLQPAAWSRAIPWVRAAGMLTHLGRPLGLNIYRLSLAIGLNPNLYGCQSVPAKKAPMKRRPRGTGKFPLIAARLPPQLILRIDRYAKGQKISRSEALRALILKGFDSTKS
jgi:hypothetical protein